MQTGSRPGILTGDLVVLTSGSTCALVQITDNTNPDTVTVVHAGGRYNLPGGKSVGVSGFAYDLGPNPQLLVWSVANGALQYNDTLHTDVPAVVVATGIVNLKAEYGIDTNGDSAIDLWTPISPTTSAGWLGVRAIRVALLARSGQWDKNYCSPNPIWTSGATGPTPFTMTNLDGSTPAACTTPPDSNPNRWQNYRYRVYETIIPLRNMIWGTAP